MVPAASMPPQRRERSSEVSARGPVSLSMPSNGTDLQRERSRARSRCVAGGAIWSGVARISHCRA